MVSKAFSVKVQKANIVGFKGKRFLSQLLILATAALKLQETRCKVVVVYQWLIYLFVFPYRRPDFPHRIANPWSFNWKEWTILKLRIVFYLVDKTGYLSLGCILSERWLQRDKGGARIYKEFLQWRPVSKNYYQLKKKKNKTDISS